MLRQVLYRHVPRSLVDRPKMGFGIPVSATGCVGRSGLGPRTFSPRTRSPATACSTPGRSGEPGSLHLSKRRDLGYELWDVLMLEAWLDRWMSPAAS